MNRSLKGITTNRKNKKVHYKSISRKHQNNKKEYRSLMFSSLDIN